MTKVPEAVFDSGLLDKVHHERLLADLPSVAAIAGVPPKFVWTRLSAHCSQDEITWVRRLRNADSNGLVYTGKMALGVEERMMAMVGAFLRNYIDARLMSVQDVIARLKDDAMPTPTVLLIPNFCIDKAEGGDIPQWQVSSLLGLLYARVSRGQKTVICAPSLTALEKLYGQPFRAHVESNYTIL